ncbi:MAG TPA: replicative DNA helicase [Candidatus Paceibacterota bacterium]
MAQTVASPYNIRKELRVPPHSLDTEKAVLGSIMLRKEALYDINDVISPDSFYSEKHKLIYTIMIELAAKNDPIDILSLKTKLEERSILEQAGGAAYLAELVHTVPSASSVVHYAEIVQKKYMMRRLILASEKLAALGFEESGDLEDILDKAEQQVYELANKGGSTRKFVEMKDALHEAWEALDKLHNAGDAMRGVPTGFRDLDAKLSGLQKSDLVILAARPSVGKTSFALDLARNAAELGTSVAIFSLEMSAHQLTTRMLSAASYVDSWKIRTAKLQDDDFMKLRDGIEKLSKAPIYIDDQPGTNLIKMRSTCRRLKSEKGLGLIIVDYLQLILPTQAKSDNVVQQITEISRGLKMLAREMDVPVLALSQLSRAVEQRGGKPRLSDLRDSGSIEQDADVVMFIHREDRYKEHDQRDGIAEILIEKHRNGPTGVVQLKFVPERTTFLTMDKSDFGDFGDAMM